MLPHELVEFAHNSERQFATLLDFYEIGWTYEPRTFVLATGIDGQPTSAFTPDFYLPDFDVFIEVTTLSQKLVTKKNRKVRLLREQHPDVQIRLLYQRDYFELLVRFGLESPDQLPPAEAAERFTAAEPVGLLGLGALARPAAAPGQRCRYPAA